MIDESQPITALENGTSADFEMPAVGDDSDEFLDFTSFDDQSLRLFTPFEQSFFASLEIPMLIEITKVACCAFRAASNLFHLGREFYAHSSSLGQLL